MIVSPDGQELIIQNKKLVANEEKFNIKNGEVLAPKTKSDNMVQYKMVKSNVSCKLSEIKGFVYGGFSSRFCLLRKHTNFLDWAEIRNLPFYAWDCISL